MDDVVAVVITDEQLTCADCIFRSEDPTVSGTCMVYTDIKPLQVLRGGDCMVKEARG